MVLPVFLAASALFAANGAAHPFKTGPVPAAAHIERRVVNLDNFRLPSKATYTKTDEVIEQGFNRLVKKADFVSTATELVKQTVPGAEFRQADGAYVGTNGIAHVHFKQTAHGLDIDNADFNVNIAKDGSILSFGHSFFKGDIPAESPLQKRDFIDPVAAVSGANGLLQLSVEAGSATAEKQSEIAETYTIKGVEGAVQDPVSKLVYFQTEDGELKLTWRVETDIYSNWLLSYVDAATNENILGVVDYSADATYNVLPWGVNDPSIGSRVIETDPWDTTASEFGWHSTGTTDYTVTRGNNAIAQTNHDGDTAYINEPRPASSSLDFDYPYSLEETDFKVYANASITQLFYTSNMFHDQLYLLGFDEAAGNFESNNNNQGGRGGDFVILNAQDGSGTNNANFATPVDGQSGRMRMYMWTRSTPQRDCSFDAGVVIHEYTHGLSNRLTGGPANSGCLSNLESGGMGEGWSDFYAVATQLKTADSRSTNYPVGAWVFNNPAGIRLYPYSTSTTTNPLTYASVNSQSAVHQIGTTWNTILYEVLWNLIDKHGITNDIRPSFDSAGVPTDGRYLTMKLVLDGLALQPCNPNFVQARNAIIDADKALTGGANACELWTGFAKRGLGQNAARNTGNSRTQDFTVPAGVC